MMAVMDGWWVDAEGKNKKCERKGNGGSSNPPIRRLLPKFCRDHPAKTTPEGLTTSSIYFLKEFCL